MAAATKRCFVVSPIGEEGSATRGEADDLFDLVIEPALATFGFEVIRADKIAGPGPITTEIVDLVQNAELCVVDLTGKNANVFYECGRRHETGKPFVQLARRGEDLPFDVAGIRTIFYDLSTPRSVKEASDELHRYVAEFAKSGFGTFAGSSLSTLATAMERVETKIDRLLGTPGRVAGATSPRRRQFAGIPGLTNPREAFIEAVMEDDVAEAERVVPRLKEVFGPTNSEFVAAVSNLADAGSFVGANELLEILTSEERVRELDPTTLKVTTGSIVSFYINRDAEAEAIERLQPVFEAIVRDAESDNDKAFFINQLQKLYYGGGLYEEAQRHGEEAMRLAPHDPSYRYNLALVYQKRKLLDLAEREVDAYMQGDKPITSPDHLALAIEIYVDRQREDDARAAYEKLSAVGESSRKSMRVLLDENVQQAIAAIAERR
jgi:tetratricopeptide (TPR) repeat protein